MANRRTLMVTSNVQIFFHVSALSRCYCHCFAITKFLICVGKESDSCWRFWRRVYILLEESVTV